LSALFLVAAVQMFGPSLVEQLVAPTLPVDWSLPEAAGVAEAAILLAELAAGWLLAVVGAVM
jgi:hypothetical protein